MESRIEALPNELLDAILNQLNEAGLARLMAGNKQLKLRIEPVLYGRKAAQQTALCWAFGNARLDVIRLLVSYGVSVGDLFDGCLSGLIRNLCLPANWARLGFFYDEGIDKQVVDTGQWPGLVLPLIPLIQAGAPADIVQLVLDQGADLNQTRPYRQRDALCPLSSAIIVGSEPVWRLLLERGADIHGKDIDSLPKTGLHIPVFAAASTMAVADHGRAMMQRCLDLGADLNRCIPAISHCPPRKWKRPKAGMLCYSGEEYHYITPLLVFLESISSWRNDAYPDPVDGLTWLLEHGALAVVEDPCPPAHEDSAWRQRHSLKGRAERHTAIDLLLDKWALRKLSNVRFRAVIKLLVQRGAARGRALRLLIKCDDMEEYGRPAVGSAVTKATRGRENLVQTIFLDDPEADNLDDVFTSYMTHHIRSSSLMTVTSIATVDQLLAAGANINARVNGQQDGPTMLHVACSRYNHEERTRYTGWYNQEFPRDAGVLQRQPKLELLLQRGADPNLTTQGKTATDLLMKNIEVDTLRDDVMSHFESLARTLRRERT